MNCKLYFFFLFLLPLFLCSQNLLNQPESIEFNHLTDEWLVANHGDGLIISIDSEGNQSIFNSELSSTRGLKVRGNQLFAASNDGFAIIDLVTGNLENLLYIAEAELLNDFDFYNDSIVFISDYWGEKVYKIDLDSFSYELFIDYGELMPNGMLYDEINNKFIICAWHNGSLLQSFDPETAETTILLTPPFGGLDGADWDLERNYYVSSWSDSAVYKYDHNFENEPILVSNGHAGPADIFVQEFLNILAVPNYYTDTIDLISLESTNIVENNIEPPFSIDNYPNPFISSDTRNNSQISFKIEVTDSFRNANLDIFNIKGQLIRKILIPISDTKTNLDINWDLKNDSGKIIASGIYFYRLKTDSFSSRTKKMIIFN